MKSVRSSQVNDKELLNKRYNHLQIEQIRTNKALEEVEDKDKPNDNDNEEGDYELRISEGIVEKPKW